MKSARERLLKETALERLEFRKSAQDRGEVAILGWVSASRFFIV